MPYWQLFQAVFTALNQTGLIFRSSGVSLDVIIPVVYRLENMGRDPSEEETKHWISLTEANISDFADYEGIDY